MEIQEGKTTIVSIIKLATHNLFNTWSSLAAPLQEGGGRGAQTGLQAPGSAPSVTVNLTVYFRAVCYSVVNQEQSLVPGLKHLLFD